MVIADTLQFGLAVNTAGVLAVTLGGRVDTLVGPDVENGSGERHVGLIQIPLPILTASSAMVKQIRAQAVTLETVLTVDMTESAQQAQTYPDYLAHLGTLSRDDVVYLGIGLYGPKKEINKLTGQLPLLR
jgi:hypothetical protein